VRAEAHAATAQGTHARAWRAGGGHLGSPPAGCYNGQKRMMSLRVT
jgi:hypothetical protein